jgi:hypothetical protein
MEGGAEKAPLSVIGEETMTLDEAVSGVAGAGE